MGIPKPLVDKMFLVPSDELYVLTIDESKSIPHILPAFDEWASSKCVQFELSAQENEQWNELENAVFSRSLSNVERLVHDELRTKRGKYRNCREEALIEASAQEAVD